MARETATAYHRYIISSFDILIPNEDPIKVLAANINYMSIEKDFDHDHFPILYFNLNIEPKVYYQIMQNKTSVRFRIRMDKYLYEEDESVKFKELVFNDTFVMFTDENAPFMDEELYDKTREITGDDTQITDFRESYDLFLFKEKDISGTKKVINTVVTSASMMNTVIYLLSSANINNILMTPFDNNAIYNEILLLPIAVIPNINYLEKQYGFYNYGMMLFFDFSTAYCISKRPAATAYRTNEYVDVLIVCNKSANPYSIHPGSYTDDKQKCYILNVSKDNVSMLTDTIISDQLYGNDILVVDPAQGSSNGVNPSVQQWGTASKQVVIDNYSNPYVVKSLEYRKKESDSIIQVNFSDIDIDCLVPNKHFLFSFEDTSVQKDRGGDYRISSAVFDFKKEGLEFSVTGTATFKRPK